MYPLIKSTPQGQIRADTQKRKMDDHVGRAGSQRPISGSEACDTKRRHVSADTSAANVPDQQMEPVVEPQVAPEIPEQPGPVTPASGSAGIGLDGSHEDVRMSNEGGLSALHRSIAQEVDLESFQSLRRSFRKLGFDTSISELIGKCETEFGMCHGLDPSLVLDFSRVNPHDGSVWDFTKRSHRDAAKLAANSNSPML
eukprot:8727323-Pyramimonas_sp.AAC.1